MSSNTKAVRTQQGVSSRTRNIAFTGMFAAIAAVLMFLEFPLPFAPSFYELDFSEVPVLIGTFALGPVSGMVIELIKILVKTVIKGTHTAGVGEVANFIIGCSLCVRQCEHDAVHVENNLARVAYENCTQCGKCAEKCPTGVITRPRGERPAAQGGQAMGA